MTIPEIELFKYSKSKTDLYDDKNYNGFCHIHFGYLQTSAVSDISFLLATVGFQESFWLWLDVGSYVLLAVQESFYPLSAIVA